MRDVVLLAGSSARILGFVVLPADEAATGNYSYEI